MPKCSKCKNTSVANVGRKKDPVCQQHLEVYYQQARNAARRLFGLSPA